MTKVAIYVRVSTIMQADRFSLPMQKNDLMNYCKAMLGTEDYVIFEDAGFSGKNTDRPAFQDMMKRVRATEFSHVLVWKLDRISRNLLDFAQMYTELKKLGVTFISRNEAFDTSTAMGEAMLKIILVFAELERNMTAERVTATMVSRASSGKWNGSSPPFGFSYDKETKTFSINEDEHETALLMLRTFKATKNFHETARRLNSAGRTTRRGAGWDPKGIKRVLTSPFSYGDYVYNTTSKNREITNPEDKWVSSKGHHPSLFPEEERGIVQGIIDSLDRRLHTQTSRERPFRKLVICGTCGGPMYPGGSRPYAGGYAPAMFRCHACECARKPYRGVVSDPTIGKYVIPILSGLIRAQDDPGLVPTPEALEKLLLSSDVYKDASIAPEDLGILFRQVGRSHEALSPDAPPEGDREGEKAALMESIRTEKRALDRLNHIYLYDDASMTEQEYMQRHSEITSRIAKLEDAISALSDSSDDAVEYMASHLLMKAYLLSDHPDYMEIVRTVSIPVFQEYLLHTIRSVTMTDKKMTCITLYSGLQVTISYR